MGTPGCLFYDASVLFTLLEGQVQKSVLGKPPDDSFFINADRMHSQAAELRIPCFASSESYELLDGRIRSVNEFVANEVRSALKFIRDGKTSSGKLTTFDPDEDIFMIEKFMLEEFRPLGESKKWEKESLRLLERLIYDAIYDATAKATKVVDTEKILEALASILVEVNEVSDARNTALVKLKEGVKDARIVVDPPLRLAVGTEVLIGDPEDVRQLTAAIQHQGGTNLWTVFVSTDYAHIISVAEDLSKSFKLTCSPPLYAISHLKSLVKKSGPLPDPRKGKYIA